MRMKDPDDRLMAFELGHDPEMILWRKDELIGIAREVGTEGEPSHQ